MQKILLQMQRNILKIKELKILDLAQKEILSNEYNKIEYVFISDDVIVILFIHLKNALQEINNNEVF
jgi:hypothetical protein